MSVNFYILLALNNGSVGALYGIWLIILIAFFCNLNAVLLFVFCIAGSHTIMPNNNHECISERYKVRSAAFGR